MAKFTFLHKKCSIDRTQINANKNKHQWVGQWEKHRYANQVEPSSYHASFGRLLNFLKFSLLFKMGQWHLIKILWKLRGSMIVKCLLVLFTLNEPLKEEPVSICPRWLTVCSMRSLGETILEPARPRLSLRFSNNITTAELAFIRFKSQDRTCHKGQLTDTGWIIFKVNISIRQKRV